jgi:alpha-L-fucosidase
MYFHCNRWPGKEFSIGGIRNKILSVKLMNGPAVEFEQIADRLILRGLPEKAPNALVTVIEIEVEGKPLQVLSFGYKLVRNDPWQPETAAGYDV